MAKRILIALMLTVSFGLLAQVNSIEDKGLSKLTLKNLNISKAFMTSGVNRKDVVKTIKKQDWKNTIPYLSGAQINIKNIIFTNKFAFEIRFNYATNKATFETDLYVDATKVSNLSLENLSIIWGYMEELRHIVSTPSSSDVLNMTNMDLLDRTLDYRVQGESLCDFGGEYKGSIFIDNIELSKIKKSTEWENFIGNIEDGNLSQIMDQLALTKKGLLVLQIKDYLIAKELSANEHVKEIVLGITNNMITSADKKAEQIETILKSKNMFQGQIRDLLCYDPVNHEEVIARLNKISSIDFYEHYKNIDLPEDASTILGYHNLKVGLSCFIDKLRTLGIQETYISMDNSISETTKTPPEKTLDINMKDFFSFDNN